MARCLFDLRLGRKPERAESDVRYIRAIRSIQRRRKRFITTRERIASTISEGHLEKVRQWYIGHVAKSSVVVRVDVDRRKTVGELA